MISVEYIVKDGKQVAADFISYCRFCSRKAHLKVTGKKKMAALGRYLWDSTMLTQELPFEASEREFIRSGVCPDCSSNMGITVSKNIKYVRKERR